MASVACVWRGHGVDACAWEMGRNQAQDKSAVVGEDVRDIALCLISRIGDSIAPHRIFF